MTAFALATNEDDDIHLEVGGPNSEGKYAAWVTHGEYHRPLVSTQPVFDSEEAARTYLDELIRDCKTWFAKQVEAGDEWAVAIADTGRRT
jgi:hypothetical protein